jgi:hypothetical protein
MPFADPDKAREYHREYRRRRRGGDGCTTPGTTPLPLPFRLQTQTTSGPSWPAVNSSEVT